MFMGIPSSSDRVAPKAKEEKQKAARSKRKKKRGEIMFMLADLMTKQSFRVDGIESNSVVRTDRTYIGSVWTSL